MENKKLIELWIDQQNYEENLKTNAQGVVAFFKKPLKSKEPIHVREISPELDAAYAKCENALESYRVGFPEFPSGISAERALDALRKAREE